MKLYTVNDNEFSLYGKLLDYNCDEIISVAEKTQKPETGAVYFPSVNEFEELQIKDFLQKEIFGEMKIQVGLCHGHNTKLNALEWHKSSEINIAVTDAVLFLGDIRDICENRYNSENIKAFLIKKGQAVEIYATTLHFTPCQTNDGGFGMIVVLPEGTNTDLDFETDDRLLFRKNKWIIAHEDNSLLIEKGVKPGVFGKNYEVGKDL